MGNPSIQVYEANSSQVGFGTAYPPEFLGSHPLTFMTTLYSMERGIRKIDSSAALALKARYALYMGDYDIVVAATKAVMDLGIYSLHKDYGDLFLTNTKNAEESIFLIPRSIEYNVVMNVRGWL